MIETLHRCEHELKRRTGAWEPCNAPAVCYEDHEHARTGGHLRLYFCAKHAASKRLMVPTMRVTRQGTI